MADTNDTNYGATIPRRGRELIAKVLASKTPLKITRIMVGQGQVPEDIFPGDLEDLIEPVAAATSTEPYVDADTVKMTVEYRSDLNGGLEYGFWIREFGVFAEDPDDQSSVMIYYGTLGSYPQWVSAYNVGLDTRRFDVEITVGEGATVVVDYTPEAFTTSDDVISICTAIALPEFLKQAQALIDAHNTDATAHPSIRTAMASLDSRLSLLELMYNTDVSGNPFTVTFGTLTDLTVEGVWNQTQSRIEF